MKRLPNPSRVRWLAMMLVSATLALGLVGRAACGETVAAAPAAAVAPAGDLPGGLTPEDYGGPVPIKVDAFNPDKGAPHPALGGRVIMHLSPEPPSLCYPVENSATTPMVLRELHAPLIVLNWETWDYDLVLAKAVEKEDTLILKGGRTAENGNILFGLVEDAGDDYVIRSGSPSNPIQEQRIPKSDVESLERQTVFTFHLRDDVKWHDGHHFDADDVLFSWKLYLNPDVRCGEKRYRFEQIVDGQALDKNTIRFFYKQQYFQAFQSFDDSFCILPRHLYDLTDPDCKDFNAKATPAECAKYINENPHNFQWVGLGPYKMKEWAKGQSITAVRNDDYFEKDPAKRGYLDEIVWRVIADDNAAFQALLNGELDIFTRVKSEDYYGEATAQKLFTDKFYKCFTYTGYPMFLSWNMYDPILSDVNVRRALGMAFDMDDWIKTKYLGLGVRITGTEHFLGKAYDQKLEPLAFDPEKATQLLEDAGWYDHDDDGFADKDGKPLEIGFLMPAGNKASEAFGQRLQESYAKIGVRVKIEQLDWATFQQRRKQREFSSANLAWVAGEFESDPYQIWHGSQAVHDLVSSNDSGFSDPACDKLIEAGRRELDAPKRFAMWKDLQARIYDQQPYMFMINVPTKLAINKDIHGVKLYKLYPGIRLRDMYYEEGTPGTRPLNRN